MMIIGYNFGLVRSNVGKTIPFLPPMTGKGQTPTYEKCDDWGMVYYCFTNIIAVTN